MCESNHHGTQSALSTLELEALKIMTWVRDLELSNIIASTLPKKGNDETQSGSRSRCFPLLVEPLLHKRAWKVIQELGKGCLPSAPPNPTRCARVCVYLRCGSDSH